jgi:outer membrane lipoprotein-sorting protein
MKRLLILAAVVLAVTPAVFGQGMRGAQGDRASGRLARMLGKTTSFTATAQSTTLESSGTETITEMGYAVRDGMVRIETDLTKTKTMRKGKPVKKRNDEMEGMAGMGLDKQVTLILPDRQAMFLVYPGMKAYCDMPKAAAADSKTEWTEQGRETIDGHPCIKYLVTTTKADGTKEESTSWKATDLQNFIIQTVSVSDNGTTTLKFSNIKLDKPAAALFELPPDFKRYGSIQEMMMGSMQQMMPKMGGTGE